MFWFGLGLGALVGAVLGGHAFNMGWRRWWKSREITEGQVWELADQPGWWQVTSCEYQRPLLAYPGYGPKPPKQITLKYDRKRLLRTGRLLTAAEIEVHLDMQAQEPETPKPVRRGPVSPR